MRILRHRDTSNQEVNAAIQAFLGLSVLHEQRVLRASKTPKGMYLKV